MREGEFPHNSALRGYLGSCTHAVVVRFHGDWSVVTWCQSREEARRSLHWWRSHSSWKHKIIQIKENPYG